MSGCLGLVRGSFERKWGGITNGFLFGGWWNYCKIDHGYGHVTEYTKKISCTLGVNYMICELHLSEAVT